MNELIRIFFKDFTVYSLQPILIKLISFLLIPLYTAYLTPADYGNLQYVLTFGSFFSIIIGLGVNSSYWKFKSKSSKYNPNEVALNLLLIQVYFGLVMFIISILVYFVFFYNQILAILIIAYFFAELISTIYNAGLLFYRAKHQSRKYFIAGILQSIILLSTNIIAITYFKLNYIGIIVAYLISFFISSLLLVKFVISECKGLFNMELSKEMIKYGLPIMLANLAMIVVSLSDRFFLKYLSTDTDLGIYSYGYKLADLVKVLVISPFLLAWTPIRWQIFDLDNHLQIFAKINRFVVTFLPIIALIIGSFVLLLANFFTINPQYLNFTKMFSFIIFSNIFFGLYYFNSMGLLFKSKTKTLMNLIIIASVVNICLNFCLIPYYGMLGAAISTLVSYFILFVSTTWFSQMVFNIHRRYYIELFQILFCLIALILLTIMAYKFSNIYLIGLFYLIAAVIYLFLAIILRVVSINEIYIGLKGIIIKKGI